MGGTKRSGTHLSEKSKNRLREKITSKDDVPVIALTLGSKNLSKAMQTYFQKCQDKLGFIPNVLLAYSFDSAKLKAFVAMYNDLMLGESGLSKLEREMIAVAVSAQNRCYYCLTAHGAAVRQYSADPVLGEQIVMNYRVARINKLGAAQISDCNRGAQMFIFQVLAEGAYGKNNKARN